MGVVTILKILALILIFRVGCYGALKLSSSITLYIEAEKEGNVKVRKRAARIIISAFITVIAALICMQSVTMMDGVLKIWT